MAGLNSLIIQQFKDFFNNLNNFAKYLYHQSFLLCLQIRRYIKEDIPYINNKCLKDLYKTLVRTNYANKTTYQTETSIESALFASWLSKT